MVNNLLTGGCPAWWRHRSWQTNVTICLRDELLVAAARLPRLFGIGLIRLYRATLSPVLGRQCRYLPTCSEYAEEAIGRHGLWAGTWIGIARFQRCGPFGASGHDPIPQELPTNSAWYLPWRYGRWTGNHIDPKTRLDLGG